MCAIIGFGPSAAAAASLARPDFPWERLVAAASRFGLTPAMHWRLGERGLAHGLPEEVGTYFASAAWLARDRNRRELDQLARVARLLNRCGVRPILLKGAASLVAGTYPETAGRLLSDLDLLVPPGGTEPCVAALAAEGYQARQGAVRDFHQRRALHHHYPRLFHPREPAGVELHEELTRKPPVLLTSAEVQGDARPRAWRGAEIALPSPRHRLLHCALHGLRDYQAGRPIALRQLFEYALLASSSATGTAVPGAAQARVLRRFSAFAQLLLGFTDPHAPAPGVADRLLVSLHLLRLTELPWLGALAAARPLPGHWLRAAAHPSSFLRLAQPGFYIGHWTSFRRAGRRRLAPGHRRRTRS